MLTCLDESNMIRLSKILKFMEDPKYPCLGPHIRVLSFTGLWHPDMKSKIVRLKLTFFYFTVAFFISQYIKCMIKFDVESLKLMLQYAPFHIGVVKTCSFQWNYKKWERLIGTISNEEIHQISKNDEKQGGIIKDYIKRSRKVTYLFFCLGIICNFSIFTEPYQKNQVGENGTSVYVYMFDGYTPFAREPPGYYITMLIQTLVGNLMSTCVVAWDMMVVSIMIFFTGQLRTSRLFCKRACVFNNAQKSHKNIAECHRFHTALVQCQKEFNDLISPVMCIYLMVVSISLGVCIINIAEIEDDVSTLASGCVFIASCLIQLLLFYWHANDVTVESELVSYSTFKSNWVESNKSIQQEIALLSSTTRTRLIFKAGPFNEMSLSTFVGILRSSYSFYTLLKGTN